MRMTPTAKARVNRTTEALIILFPDIKPEETALEHLLSVDVLGQVISDESVLSRLYSLDGHGDVDDQGHEAEAE